VSNQRLNNIHRGFYETSEALRKELSPDSPPEIFKGNSLTTVKTRLTGNAKILFTDVRKSEVLQDNQAFATAEQLLSRGVDAIRRRG
jgi:hypothetical protein